MKMTIAISAMLLAVIALTYLSMWQMKNIDTGGKLLNRELFFFLVVYGLLIFFFLNPTITLSFRYCFSQSGKLMAPQLIYSATGVISPLIITWLIFGETPSKGIIAGSFFAIISVLCVLFWK